MNSLTVQTVGHLLGIELPAKGMVRCPLKGHDDHTPSFEVRCQGHRWVCYGCNKSGGPIDLVMAYQNKSFLEAKHWLAEMCGLGTAGGKHSSLQTGRRDEISQRRVLPTSGIATEIPSDHKLYAALMARAPLRKVGTDYLRGRRISEATLARFGIGQMPSITVIRELVSEFGFARVETSGLLTQTSRLDRYWPVFPEGALLFPYFEGGQIVYFQARVTDDSDKRNRWRNLNHRRRRLYNADTLADTTIRRVGICEGAMDVLSATQLGCEAVGLIGVNAKLSDIDIMALRGRQVDLLLDWDDAGEKRAMTLRRELERFGVAATRKSAPPGGAKDVNVYLQQGNSKL